MCMCLALGGVDGKGGKWMRGLRLGFNNPVGTGEVLDVCLVGSLDHGLEGWGVVMSV